MSQFGWVELQEPKIRISTTVKLLKTFSQMNFVSPFGFMLILFHIFVCLLFACVFLLFVFLFYFAPLWPTASQRSSPSSRSYSRRTCAASCCCLARSFRSPATPGQTGTSVQVVAPVTLGQIRDILALVCHQLDTLKLKGQEDRSCSGSGSSCSGSVSSKMEEGMHKALVHSLV